MENRVSQLQAEVHSLLQSVLQEYHQEVESHKKTQVEIEEKFADNPNLNFEERVNLRAEAGKYLTEQADRSSRISHLSGKVSALTAVLDMIDTDDKTSNKNQVQMYQYKSPGIDTLM